MRRIAIIHAGSYFHLAALQDPAVIAWEPTSHHAPTLQPGDLDDADAVLLFSRQHPTVMQRIAPILLDYAATPGRRVVIEGENAVDGWLPGADWTPHPVNFWAWRTGEDVGIRRQSADHPLWQLFSERSVRWHFHGTLALPPGATSLAGVERDGRDLGSILYRDDVSFPAELLVTTMDASYHHGAGFMPGATQLLYRLLRWAGQD